MVDFFLAVPSNTCTVSPPGSEKEGYWYFFVSFMLFVVKIERWITAIFGFMTLWYEAILL